MPNADVDTIGVLDNGHLLLGGAFTSPYNYMIGWNKTNFYQIGNNDLNGAVVRINVINSTLIYISGKFTSAGGLSLNDYCAIWNGTTFLPLDIDLPSSAFVHTAVSIKPPGFVIEPNFYKNDVAIGMENTGPSTASYQNTVTTTNGTAITYPYIYIKRDGVDGGFH